MLHYEITNSYLSFIKSLPFQERGNALWKSQAILSNAGGYLKMKVAGLSDELSIFKIHDNTFVLVYSDFQKIVLIDGKKDSDIPQFDSKDETPLVSKTIKELLAKDGSPLPNDDLERFLEANYFTSWFIKLLSFLPANIRNSWMDKDIMKKEASVSVEEKTKNVTSPQVKEVIVPTPLKRKQEEDIIKKPITKQTILPNPVIERDRTLHKPQEKRNVDGAEYEKAILKELQEAYAKRQEKRKQKETNAKPSSSAPLKHVVFAPKEIVIPYHEEGTCLDQLIKKTRQNGCHISDKDWLILLANTVDESFAKEIEYRYPGHVMYTDNPNKGSLRLAIIVKYKDAFEEEDFSVKRVKSKQASFQKDLPSGAFENVDDEDYWEAQERRGDSEIRRVKSKVANFQPVLSIDKTVSDEEDDMQKDEDGYLMDFDADYEDDFLENEPDFDEQASSKEMTETPSYPRYWHCYICGKKKSYSGEPAETVKLSSGKVVYLCKKHRGKM